MFASTASRATGIHAVIVMCVLLGHAAAGVALWLLSATPRTVLFRQSAVTVLVTLHAGGTSSAPVAEPSSPSPRAGFPQPMASQPEQRPAGAPAVPHPASSGQKISQRRVPVATALGPAPSSPMPVSNKLLNNREPVVAPVVPTPAAPAALEPAPDPTPDPTPVPTSVPTSVPTPVPTPVPTAAATAPVTEAAVPSASAQAAVSPPGPQNTSVTAGTRDADSHRSPVSAGIHYLRPPEPSYPALARQRGEQGRVVVLVWVDERGTPGRLEVHASSGSPRLDRAALDAAADALFEPFVEHGRPVPKWALVPIAFRLSP